MLKRLATDPEHDAHQTCASVPHDQSKAALERLVTGPERKAREKIEAFIAVARHDCAAYGTDLDWDRPDWDVTAFCPKPVAKAGQRSVLYFTTHFNGTAKSMVGRTALQEPFASFMKALIRRKQDGKAQGMDAPSRIINAGRDLYDILADRNYDPVRLIHADFAEAAIKAQARATGATPYRLGCALQEIATIIDRHGLSKTRIDWCNPLKKQTNTMSRISKPAEQAREKKLPDPEVLDEIARLSHRVTPPADIVRMAAIKLFHCAPWRIGEELALGDNCEVEDSKVDARGPVLDDEGKPVVRYGLRYWKEKSTDADIKWIPSVMEDTARKAIADVLEHTQGPRELAKWLEEHPDRAWLPGPDLGPDQLYSKADVAEMFGMGRNHKAGRQWLASRHLLQEGVRDQKVRRDDLEVALLAEMVEITDDRRNLKLSQHLFLVYKNFYHAERATNPCLLTLTSDQHVSDFLSGRTSSRGSTQSVFERLGSPPAADGTPMRMNSHQFRHWLNTLGQAGGLDQALIARWSGRDDIKQNSEYDHLTGLELAERFRGKMESGEVQGALADLHNRKDPKDRADFRDTLLATGHVTEIGLCDLDWTSSSCPEFQSCETCEFCLVEKGNEGSKERTEHRLADHKWLLKRAEAEADEGTIGASNHVHALTETIAGCERILAIHEDEAIPAGTLVQPTRTSPDHFAGPAIGDAT